MKLKILLLILTATLGGFNAVKAFVDPQPMSPEMQALLWALLAAGAALDALKEA